MRGYVTDGAGRQWSLPVPTAWRLDYTCGVPCDSFWMRCPWQADNTTDPARWVRFQACEGEEWVFTGVVDECVVTQDGRGCTLELSGRGMAALLLDNEALGQDYDTATIRDILRDHVSPYGIETVGGEALPPVSRFSVATGSSEWSVLYDFARYYGGISPRFDRWGRLVLKGWEDRGEVLLTDSAPITELVCRDRRYGVLSRVLVRDRFSGAVQAVDNAAFAADGGNARRVVTMPGRSDYKTMRYTGQFQLDRSAAERERLEVTVAGQFGVWPGDLVRIRRSNWDRNGLYRAAAVTVGADERGGWTRMELARPDFVG